VHIEEITDSAYGFMAEGVSFKKNMMLIQPIHHGMIFESGFLDLQDCLGAKETAANCYEVLVGGAFGN